jgi:predicted GIY-YIG superfamily endonuclease
MTSWLDKPIRKIEPKPLRIYSHYTEKQIEIVNKVNAELLDRARSYYGSEKRLDGECWVYILFDPLKKKPIYIGISRDPWLRWKQHISDPGSGAWRRVRELRAVGISQQQILKLYKRCKDRNEAAAIEFRLIETTPGVLNKTKGKMWGAPTWQLQ